MKRTVFVAVIGCIVGLSGVVFAQEEGAPAAQPAVPGASAPAANETVWIDDALPSNAKTDGTWLWDTATFTSGTKSHGHPPGKGLQSHGFTADPVVLSATGMLTQQVWLDPKDAPKGIMLKFKMAEGDEVGVYWEGEQEVFNPGEEEEVWYYGLLPELGKWTTLEILAEDLGLEEEKIVGLTFVTFDGRALWDKSAIAEAPPAADLEFLPELPDAGTGTEAPIEEAPAQ